MTQLPPMSEKQRLSVRQKLLKDGAKYMGGRGAAGTFSKKFDDFILQSAKLLPKAEYLTNCQYLFGLWENLKRFLTKAKSGTFRAKVAHEMIDSHVDSFLARAQPISCRRGCAACCYQSVTVTASEADLLAEKIRGGLSIDPSILETQSNFSDPLQDARTFYPKGRCVFLGENEECRVYEDRPVACRSYHVVTEPKFCDLRAPRRKVGFLINPEAEAFVSALYSIEETGYLPPMLLKRLK